MQSDFKLNDDQVLRYSRQLILKEIGSKGQEKLFNSKVLVIGAGGLGSPALYYLASAGIGTLGIADFDTVTLSNLQRQILYSNDDLGQRKVVSAYDKLRRLNPDVIINKHIQRVNIDNVQDLISEYDVIVDAVDNFSTRFLISDCCYFQKKPVIEGGILGFEGILMTIIPDKTPCYRCLYPDPPKDGVVPSCSDTGVIGAIAGAIGSLQALECIKVILGIGKTLSGKILSFDSLNMEIRIIDWSKREACPLCGVSPTIKDLNEYEIRCQNKNIIVGEVL